VSERLPDRLVARAPERVREQLPPEIPALWRDPRRFRVLIASAVSMFALAIFPPFLSPGAEAIQRNLKQDPGSLGLVVIAGIALGAGTLLLGGATGDVDGHRRWLLVGLTGLLATCLFGMAFQGDEGLLIAGLLGAFWSGFAMPLGIAIVADAYPERTVQDIGIGLGLASMGVAQIVAPVIQDVLHDLVGVWAIYLLPTAAGSLAFYLVWSRVPERRSAGDLARSHVLGQALLAAIPLTIATFLIVLLPGEADVLAMLGLLLLGAIGLVVSGIRRRRGRGILPAGVTPSRMIIVALFVGVFMSFALNAPLLYFGSYLRIVRDWGEWLAVAALIPHIVPLFLGGLYAPVLTRRYGYVRVILGSMLLLAAATALFALASADTTYWWFITPLALLGLGLIFGATARTGLIMARMPRALPGLANALNLASMELGAILGQTVMTVMVMRFATARYAERLATAAVDEAAAAEATEAFRAVLRTVQPGGTTELEPSRVEGLLPGFRESMTDGISIALWLVTIATLVAFAAAALLFRWARGKDERPEAPIQTDSADATATGAS
jgi:MFS family permease